MTQCKDDNRESLKAMNAGCARHADCGNRDACITHENEAGTGSALNAVGATVPVRFARETRKTREKSAVNQWQRDVRRIRKSSGLAIVKPVDCGARPQGIVPDTCATSRCHEENCNDQSAVRNAVALGGFTHTTRTTIGRCLLSGCVRSAMASVTVNRRLVWVVEFKRLEATDAR